MISSPPATPPNTTRAPRFLARLQEKAPSFRAELVHSMQSEPELFAELAEPLLGWAHALLGEGYEDVLIDGYASFVYDVNRSQQQYEKTRRYLHSAYAQVYQTAYDCPDFMNLYHWGVYTTTFAWAHHLRLYRLFRDGFLGRILAREASGRLLDLGAGSGVWHLLARRRLPQWATTAVDISQTSVRLSRQMVQRIDPAAVVEHVCADALEITLAEPAHAGISCFLLEHLEQPGRLLANLARNLRPRAYAFVTCALTAAEYDHIFEFQRESEPVALAEEAGFRLIELLSSAPDRTPPDSFYLPRSLGMVLQKRAGEIW